MGLFSKELFDDLKHFLRNIDSPRAEGCFSICKKSFKYCPDGRLAMEMSAVKCYNNRID